MPFVLVKGEGREPLTLHSLINALERVKQLLASFRGLLHDVQTGQPVGLEVSLHLRGERLAMRITRASNITPRTRVKWVEVSEIIAHYFDEGDEWVNWFEREVLKGLDLHRQPDEA